jgi:hypothetical protein
VTQRHRVEHAQKRLIAQHLMGAVGDAQTIGRAMEHLEIAAEFLRRADRLRMKGVWRQRAMSGNTSHWPEKLAFPDV